MNITLTLRTATRADFVIKDVCHCETCTSQQTFERALAKDFWVRNSTGQLEHYTIKTGGDYKAFLQDIKAGNVFVVDEIVNS